MKFITFLFTVFFWFNAVAVAPYGFKGQQQSQTLYSNVLQGQNNLVTNMGGINALLETGNKNILTNPSFEHATFSTGWTNSAGTFTQDTSVEIDGLKAASLVLSSQSMALHQDSTLYASQFADGVQGLASIRVKTSVSGIKVCSRQAGVTVSSLCVDVQANGKWGLYKVPFILGATSNGISINSNGTSVTGTVYVDDAFVGAVDLQADTSNISDWQDFTMTIGAVTTAPTKGATSVDKAQWRRVGSDMEIRYDYKQTGAGSAGSGIYLFPIPSGYSIDYTRVPSGSADQATSGIVKLSATADSAGATTALGQVLISKTYPNKLYLNYTQSTVENTANVSSVAYQLSGATIGYSYVAKVPIVGWGASGSVYSSTNADTDWIDAGAITIGATTTAPTKGAITIDDVMIKRSGTNAEIIYKLQMAAGTAGSGDYLFSLPNGLQFDTSVVTPYSGSFTTGLELAGQNALIGYGHLSNGTSTSRGAVSLFAYDATRFRVIATQAFSAYQIFGSGFFAFSSATAFNFRVTAPIAGWQNSNIIIGQFNGLESCSSTLECTDTFSAKISAAGVVSAENVDWINGSVAIVSNEYRATFKAGIFTQAPNCSVVAGDTVATYFSRLSGITNTQAAYYNTSTAGANITTGSVNIICQKQGADYVGKTAKAVASDQNIRTPGVTKAVFYSAGLTSAGVPNIEIGDFLNGSCTCSSGSFSCSFNSGVWASAPSCQITNANSRDRNVLYPTESTSSLSFSILTQAGTGVCEAVKVSCHGVSP